MIAAGAAFAMSAAVAMPAVATVINFDQLPNGTTLPTGGTTIDTQYASLGVSFSGFNTVTGVGGPLNSWGLIAASGPGGSRNFLNNFGAITPSSPVPGPSDYLLAPRYDILTVQFTGTANAISFGLNTGATQNSVTVNAYNALGVVVQSIVGLQASNGVFDVKSLTANNVARFEIISGFNSNGSVKLYGVDNLTYTLNVDAVPETATWAMMIVGFGLTGAALRRRKSQAAIAA